MIVSRRRDNFDFLRKKHFSKLNIVDEMYAFAKFL